MTAGRHNRNPIRRHGEAASDHFTIVPNELARDAELSPYAYRVAIVIRSHADGYEVSMKSLAEMLGWKRDTVRKAMDDLVDARWLAVRRYETASGTRAFEEYHLNASRKFTEEEAAEFNQTVVLPARQKGTPMPTKRATPCPLNGHPHAHETGTKEDHLEDYPEEQSENQAVELAPGDTWDNEPPFDIPDTSEDADWGMKEGTWEAWTEAQRQAERRRSAPVPPCSVPNTIEPETHCTAAECDQSPIPHGRYCYSHLDLVAAGG